MPVDPRILLSWNVSAQIAPPIRLSENQVTVGPLNPGGQADAAFDAATPRGRYDLKEVLDRAGINGDFDWIVVKTDATCGNMPENLSAFRCPVILMPGATHIMEAPLRKMISYALEIDALAVVANCTRQHLHWFRAAGIPNCAWLPALFVQRHHQPLRAVREQRVVFAGQQGKLHWYRGQLLKSMDVVGVPVLRTMADHAGCAELYASNSVSFNASLNADLNYRVFEVISAGGCLLTDRLAPAAGLSDLFEEGRELAAYGGTEDVGEVARDLLDSPAKALAIARQGQARYLAEYTPEHQIAALRGWLDGGGMPAAFTAEADDRDPGVARSFDDLRERLEVYEMVQELHRENLRLRVLVGDDVDDVVLRDLADLPRLELHRISGVAPGVTPAAWDLLVCGPGAEAASAACRGHIEVVRSLRQPRHRAANA